MKTNRITADHDRLRRIATDFEAILASPVPCEAKTLAAIRWEIGSAVMQNLAAEERMVYTRLAETADARLPEFRQADADLHALFEAYRDHVATWTPQAIANDWQSYRASAQILIHSLMRRMDWEEREIVPRLKDGDFVQPDPDAEPRNWARDAFAIKDQIHSGL